MSISDDVKAFTREDAIHNDLYLALALDLAEKVRRSSNGHNEFLDAIKQRFATGNESIILQALKLLYIVVKNSNEFVKLEVSSRGFVNSLRKLEKLESNAVNTQLLNVLTDWIDSGEFVGCEHDLIHEYRREMAAKRIKESKEESEWWNYQNDYLSLPVVATDGPSFAKAQTQSALDSFDSDLKKAIELSLAESRAAEQEAGKTCVVRALFDFTDTEEGELSFRAGDRITVLDDSQPYWWKGVCSGRIGLFPATFVTASEEDVNAQADKEVVEEPLRIDEALLDKCLSILKSADIEAMPGSDPPELLELEQRCAAMGPLIENEISALDSLIDNCQNAHERLLQTIQLYDRECQLEANAIRQQQTGKANQ